MAENAEVGTLIPVKDGSVQKGGDDGIATFF